MGTCSLQDSNELSVLEYSEDSNQLEATAVFSHPDQIWTMEPSPQDPSLVITSRQSSSGSKAVTLWRMPRQSMQDLEDTSASAFVDDKLELEEVVSLTQSTGKQTFAHSIRWHANKDNILLGDGDIVSLYALKDGSAQQVSRFALDEVEASDGPMSFSAASSYTSGGALAWDPHSSTGCAAVHGSSLYVLDTRGSMSITAKAADAHPRATIRDVDFNPNKPLTAVTAGDDRKVRIWDLRNLQSPVKTLSGHSHWVWSAKFNPFHDQLLIRYDKDDMIFWAVVVHWERRRGNVGIDKDAQVNLVSLILNHPFLSSRYILHTCLIIFFVPLSSQLLFIRLLLHLCHFLYFLCCAQRGLG